MGNHVCTDATPFTLEDIAVTGAQLPEAQVDRDRLLPPESAELFRSVDHNIKAFRFYYQPPGSHTGGGAGASGGGRARRDTAGSGSTPRHARPTSSSSSKAVRRSTTPGSLPRYSSVSAPVSGGARASGNLGGADTTPVRGHQRAPVHPGGGAAAAMAAGGGVGGGGGRAGDAADAAPAPQQDALASSHVHCEPVALSKTIVPAYANDVVLLLHVQRFPMHGSGGGGSGSTANNSARSLGYYPRSGSAAAGGNAYGSANSTVSRQREADAERYGPEVAPPWSGDLSALFTPRGLATSFSSNIGKPLWQQGGGGAGSATTPVSGGRSGSLTPRRSASTNAFAAGGPHGVGECEYRYSLHLLTGRAAHPLVAAVAVLHALQLERQLTGSAELVRRLFYNYNLARLGEAGAVGGGDTAGAVGGGGIGIGIGESGAAHPTVSGRAGRGSVMQGMRHTRLTVLITKPTAIGRLVAHDDLGGSPRLASVGGGGGVGGQRRPIADAYSRNSLLRLLHTARPSGGGGGSGGGSTPRGSARSHGSSPRSTVLVYSSHAPPAASASALPHAPSSPSQQQKGFAHNDTRRASDAIPPPPPSSSQVPAAGKTAGDRGSSNVSPTPSPTAAAARQQPRTPRTTTTTTTSMNIAIPGDTSPNTTTAARRRPHAATATSAAPASSPAPASSASATRAASPSTAAARPSGSSAATAATAATTTAASRPSATSSSTNKNSSKSTTTGTSASAAASAASPAVSSAGAKPTMSSLNIGATLEKRGSVGLRYGGSDDKNTAAAASAANAHAHPGGGGGASSSSSASPAAATRGAAALHEDNEIRMSEDRVNRLKQAAPVATEVLPFLFVGGETAARDREQLLQKGITAVVNTVAFDIRNLHNDVFQYLSLYLCDSPDEPIFSLFPVVTRFIEEQRRAGGKVFVHCHQGVSRSCSFVIAYVMWQQGLCYDRAYELVRARRLVCSPNTGFYVNLHLWEDQLSRPVLNKGYAFVPYTASYLFPFSFRLALVFRRPLPSASSGSAAVGAAGSQSRAKAAAAAAAAEAEAEAEDSAVAIISAFAQVVEGEDSPYVLDQRLCYGFLFGDHPNSATAASGGGGGSKSNSGGSSAGGYTSSSIRTRGGGSSSSTATTTTTTTNAAAASSSSSSPLHTFMFFGPDGDAVVRQRAAEEWTHFIQYSFYQGPAHTSSNDKGEAIPFAPLPPVAELGDLGVDPCAAPRGEDEGADASALSVSSSVSPASPVPPPPPLAPVCPLASEVHQRVREYLYSPPATTAARRTRTGASAATCEGDERWDPLLARDDMIFTFAAQLTEEQRVRAGAKGRKRARQEELRRLTHPPHRRHGAASSSSAAAAAPGATAAVGKHAKHEKKPPTPPTTPPPTGNYARPHPGGGSGGNNNSTVTSSSAAPAATGFAALPRDTTDAAPEHSRGGGRRAYGNSSSSGGGHNHGENDEEEEGEGVTAGASLSAPRGAPGAAEVPPDVEVREYPFTGPALRDVIGMEDLRGDACYAIVVPASDAPGGDRDSHVFLWIGASCPISEEAAVEAYHAHLCVPAEEAGGAAGEEDVGEEEDDEGRVSVRLSSGAVLHDVLGEIVAEGEEPDELLVALD